MQASIEELNKTKEAYQREISQRELLKTKLERENSSQLEKIKQLTDQLMSMSQQKQSDKLTKAH